jgi:tetratricopeptide (TPR) repeat protein
MRHLLLIHPVVFLVFLTGALPALAQEPTALDRSLRAAENEIAAGRSGKALAQLTALRATEKTDARIPFLMAQCEFNLWLADPEAKPHLVAARRHIAAALELKTPYPECSFLSGWVEAKAGNFGQAAEGYRAAIAGGYEVLISRQNLAISLFRYGLALEPRIDSDPKVTAKLVIDIFQEARERFRLLALDTRYLPRDRTVFRDHQMKAWSILASLNLKARNYAAAETLLRGLVEATPRDASPYHHLGLVFESQDRTKEAVRWYEKALEVGKPGRFVESHLRLAGIRSREGNREKAEEHFAAYFAVSPKSWAGHYERGLHYRRSVEYSLAIADFLRCLEIDAEGYAAMKELSECYRLSGDEEKAGEWLSKYLAKRDAAAADRPVAPPEDEDGKKE